MRRIDKPWGHELVWAETDRYVGKVLHIKKGHCLSRQYHNKKDETFYVQAGTMELEIGERGEEKMRLEVGQGYHCKPLTVHRMIAITDVDVLEASTPELDDVVRLEDAYGRKSS